MVAVSQHFPFFRTEGNKPHMRLNKNYGLNASKYIASKRAFAAVLLQSLSDVGPTVQRLADRDTRYYSALKDHEPEFKLSPEASIASVAIASLSRGGGTKLGIPRGKKIPLPCAISRPAWPPTSFHKAMRYNFRHSFLAGGPGR